MICVRACGNMCGLSSALAGVDIYQCLETRAVRV